MGRKDPTSIKISSERFDGPGTLTLFRADVIVRPDGSRSASPTILLLDFGGNPDDDDYENRIVGFELDRDGLTALASKLSSALADANYAEQASWIAGQNRALDICRETQEKLEAAQALNNKILAENRRLAKEVSAGRVDVRKAKSKAKPKTKSKASE